MDGAPKGRPAASRRGGTAKGDPRYRLTVIATYAGDGTNEEQVTANLAAGRGAHLVHCGTITMSRSEWDHLISAITFALGDDLELEDATDRPRDLG